MRKITSLLKKVIRSNFIDLPAPYKLTYIVTNRCQLKCNICNIWNSSFENELTLDEIEDFFRKSNDFSWVNLSGGEIFLRKDLPEIIEIIYRSCRNLYILDFPTNGFLTDRIEETIKKVLESYKIPKCFVTISLDGPPELHDRIRGVNGSWEKAVKTFSRLRQIQNRHFKVFFGMTLQAANKDSFKETFASVKEAAGDIKYNDFHFNVVQYSEHYYKNIGAASDLSHAGRLWGTLKQAAGRKNISQTNPVQFLEKKYQELAQVYLNTGKRPITCQALAGSFFMNPSGEVYPCSIYNKPIGNIRGYNYDIGRLYRDSKRNQIRGEIIEGKCPHCWTPCEAYQSILANLLKLPSKI